MRLRPFQRQDVEAIKAGGLRALLASAPGTGKTAIAMRVLAETHRYSLPAVIACPASVLHHWAREAACWAKGVRVVVVDDGATHLPQVFQDTILLMSWALLDARWADLQRIGVVTVVADEAHYAKNPGSLRSQALRRLCQSAKGVLLLTGTPIINAGAEMRVLEDLLGEGKPLVIRRFLEEAAPEVPPKSRSYVYMQMEERDRAEYDRAEGNFEEWLRREKEKLLGEGMAEFEVERALAAEALAKIGYLRRWVGGKKVAAASAWIGRAVRLGEPVVVFLEHQPVLRALSKSLSKQRIRHAILEGSTTPRKRQAAVDSFQNHDVPVFLGTKAAKEGITLTAARHLLFVERYFTSAEEEQAEDRIRRIGQRYATTVWFLHALGTIDDRVDAIVRGKRRVIREAIGSSPVLDTEADNVTDLLRAWAKHASPEGAQVDAALSKPLPPLPQPRTVHAVVFYGQRWKPTSARNWCRMNGYEAKRREDRAGRLKLLCTPAFLFHSGGFEVFQVSRDIRIITGKRLSQANERRARASRLRARR